MIFLRGCETAKIIGGSPYSLQGPEKGTVSPCPSGEQGEAQQGLVALLEAASPSSLSSPRTEALGAALARDLSARTETSAEPPIWKLKAQVAVEHLKYDQCDRRTGFYISFNFLNLNSHE